MSFKRLRGGSIENPTVQSDGESFQEAALNTPLGTSSIAQPVIDSVAGLTEKAATDDVVGHKGPNENKVSGSRSKAPPKSNSKLPNPSKQKPGQTLEGMTISKAADFAGWYAELVVKSEMIEYYDISGCYILRPWAYSIWERIQSHLDARIKAMGVKNCYFPMFVSKKALHAEQEHVAGFTPEVSRIARPSISLEIAAIS
jgi:hypothetical protein